MSKIFLKTERVRSICVRGLEELNYKFKKERRFLFKKNKPEGFYDENDNHRKFRFNSKMHRIDNLKVFINPSVCINSHKHCKNLIFFNSDKEANEYYKELTEQSKNEKFIEFDTNNP